MSKENNLRILFKNSRETHYVDDLNNNYIFEINFSLNENNLFKKKKLLKYNFLSNKLIPNIKITTLKQFIYEKIDLISLKEILNNSKFILSSNIKRFICCQIVSKLVYLQEFSFSHGNLSLNTIYIDKDFHIFIFGFEHITFSNNDYYDFLIIILSLFHQISINSLNNYLKDLTIYSTDLIDIIEYCTSNFNENKSFLYLLNSFIYNKSIFPDEFNNIFENSLIVKKKLVKSINLVYNDYIKLNIDFLIQQNDFSSKFVLYQITKQIEFLNFQSNHISSLIILAKKLFKENKIDESLNLFIKLSSLGDSYSMYKCGKLILMKNQNEFNSISLKYFEKSSNFGFIKSTKICLNFYKNKSWKLFKYHLNIGILSEDPYFIFDYGKRIEKKIRNNSKSLIKAYKYFEKESLKKHIDAYYYYGIIGLKLKFNQEMINNSLKYLEISFNLKNPNSTFEIGRLKLEGIYLNQNIQEGFCYIKESIKLGCLKGYNYLGECYLNGLYLSKNLNESNFYFEKSFENKDPRGIINYALILLNNKKENNYEKCFNLFKLSYELGDILGNTYCGIFYENGFFNTKNKNTKKAIELYEISIKKMESIAMYKLSLLYFKGENVEMDISYSLQLLKESINLNNSNSMLFYGLLLKEGKYCFKDLNKSLFYLEKSKKIGNIKLNDIFS